MRPHIGGLILFGVVSETYIVHRLIGSLPNEIIAALWKKFSASINFNWLTVRVYRGDLGYTSPPISTNEILNCREGRIYVLHGHI